MSSTRLEAFSDGVLAIIITIMVLELRAPHEADWGALGPLWPIFVSYVLSFVNVAIYWNNHHHMLHVTRYVNWAILWSNLHLLFWLSLVPFTTAWMGENHFAPVPTATYGGVLLMAAIAYYILQLAIIRSQGPKSVLAIAVGKDLKGKISPLFYVAAIAVAPFQPAIAGALYASVALMWLIPDQRIERLVDAQRHADPPSA